MTLAEQLHGARFVHYDDYSACTFAWYGKQAIRVFTHDGQEIDYFQLEGSIYDDAAEDAVRMAILDKVAEYQQGDGHDA